MINTQREFDKRKNEIEKYFDFINKLDCEECNLNCTSLMGVVTNSIIDRELIKILKANGFILLYNLVEATVKNSMQAIYASMSNTVQYPQLIEKIQKIWLSNIKNDDWYNTIEKIVNNQLIEFEEYEKYVSISGNIDARKIREFCSKIGCEIVPNGEDLLNVKEKRNHLAHGKVTFTEIGGQYTIREMITYKTNTLLYLEQVLEKFKDYIDNKKYLK